jgi:hypothetical protein
VNGEGLIKEMKEDIDAAAAIMASSRRGEAPLKAVWLDCVGRCCKNDAGIPQVFVGSGTGAPNMLMREAGLENAFGNVDGNWACVNVSDVIKAAPDVMIVVDAAWDTALDKVTWLYNHTDFCGMEALKGGKMIQIPFSATTLSPRNGPAALDLTIASLHVRLGALTATRKSGVGSFEPKMLREHTKGLKCSLVAADVVYDDAEDDHKKKDDHDDDDHKKKDDHDDHDDHDGHDHGDTSTTEEVANTADVNAASGHPQMRTLALGLAFVTGLPIFFMMAK